MPLVDNVLAAALSAWKRIKLTAVAGLAHRNIIFSGAWRPSDDPVEVGENFVSMENFYYGSKHPVPVTGMTKISTTIQTITGGTVSAPVVYDAIQYINDRFSENTILAHVADAGKAASSLIQNTAVVPAAGDFSTTELYTCGTSEGKFAKAPNNNVIFCDGSRDLIWGGTERPPVGVLNKDASVDFNLTDVLTNSINDANNRATLQATSSVITLYVISDRPISGIKPYIHTPNATASTTLAAHYWGAAGWTTVGTITDGTVLASKKLAQTGWITFASTVGLAKQSMQHGVQAYHYRFVWTTIADNVTVVYQLTTQCPAQPITDIWDGEGIQVQKVWRFDESANDFKDYTVNAAVQDYQPFPVVSGDEVTEVAYRITYVNISSLVRSKDALFIGCQKRLAGIICYMADKINTASCGPLAVHYFNGTTWVAVTNLQDGTLRTDTTKTFAQTGYITWDPPAETIEFKTRMKEEPYFYYYRIMVTAAGSNVDANARIDCIMGIPAAKEIRPYKFPVGSGDIVYLCNNNNDRKNAVRPASVNTATVWQDEILVGTERELTAGCCVPSQMATNATLMFKRTETWVMIGRYPKIQTVQLSDTDGCPAPKTLKTTSIPIDIAQKIGVNTGIAIWQGTNGVYISDGRVPIPIHYQIRKFFEPHKLDQVGIAIPSSMIGKSIGWMDNKCWRYHLRIASGEETTTLNRELVFDLFKMEWSEIIRGTAKNIQFGFEVEDLYGNPCQYGFIDSGYMERLDYGKDFDGEDITCRLRLGDIALADNDPIWETNLESLDVLTTAKETTTSSLQIVHYLDCGSIGKDLTVNSLSCPGKRLTMIHRNANRTGTYHGIELHFTTDDEIEGFEPMGMIMHYKAVK